ncbi:MAG: hypothetical protein PVI23_06670 [Maricaulaceae bacterium]|jgi:hypothetical protein
MIRAAGLCIAALLISGCVGPRLIGARPASPAWLDEGVARADAAHPGYNFISSAPDREIDASAAAEHQRSLSELRVLRERVVNDPVFDNPDADVDAQALSEESLARAEREAERGEEDQ